MLTRREFIKGSVIGAVAVPFSQIEIFSCSTGHRLQNIGFISGIIGKELEGDWKEVLKKAASFGYTEIETGNFLGDSPESFSMYLKSIGLKPIAGALNFNGNDQELEKNFALIKNLQMKYAVVYWPWYTGGPFSLEECRKSAERLNHLGQMCKDQGVTLCWHNHNREFELMETGQPFDFLMENTDNERVKCELDVYWVKKGGTDPLEILKKYSGRFPILHIKDMAPGPDMDFECPGSGIIDFPAIFKEAYKQGIKHYMVERDNVPDGIACIKSAAEYLKKITF